VVSFVGVGKVPCPIADAEIATIQTIIRSGAFAEPWPFLEAGQPVRVEDGPLEGVEGIYVEARKQHRIVVSVTLLKRSVSVEIERHWVKPIGSIRPTSPIAINAVRL
jgi:transcription antitermination factor NusG